MIVARIDMFMPDDWTITRTSNLRAFVLAGESRRFSDRILHIISAPSAYDYREFHRIRPLTQEKQATLQQGCRGYRGTQCERIREKVGRARHRGAGTTAGKAATAGFTR